MLPVGATIIPFTTGSLADEAAADVAALRQRPRESIGVKDRDASKTRGISAKRLRGIGKKAMQTNGADVAELVDARDLKSLDGNVVRVRLPPPAPDRLSS
jgi:hypothetical protein